MSRITVNHDARHLLIFSSRDNTRLFNEFLEKIQESRRKARYLMAIPEQLPRIHKVELQQMRWARVAELAKMARREGQTGIVSAKYSQNPSQNIATDCPA